MMFASRKMFTLLATVVALIYPCNFAHAQGIFLGTLSTNAHQVTGDVYLLSEKILEIRGFTYDGTAPAAYFWADTSSNPSNSGQVLSDGSPSSGCAMAPGDPVLPALTAVTQRVEFPGDLTIQDFLGGSLSVWCESFSANFGSIVLPTMVDESDLTVENLTLECSVASSGVSETFLGALWTNAHLVAGDVYLLSENVLEIRGFTYDGTAPAAYFWADTNPTPSVNGQVLSDGSPSNGCAQKVGDPILPAAISITQRVEFPDGLTIRDFLGGSFSVWCESFAANFGSIQLPSTLDEAEIPFQGPDLECTEGINDVPLIVKTAESYNCEPLNEDFQVRWKVNGEIIDFELVGMIPDDTYMAFGVSGATDRTFMIGADVVIAVSQKYKFAIAFLTCFELIQTLFCGFRTFLRQEKVLAHATSSWMLVLNAMVFREFVLIQVPVLLMTLLVSRENKIPVSRLSVTVDLLLLVISQRQVQALRHLWTRTFRLNKVSRLLLFGQSVLLNLLLETHFSIALLTLVKMGTMSALNLDVQWSITALHLSERIPKHQLPVHQHRFVVHLSVTMKQFLIFISVLLVGHVGTRRSPMDWFRGELHGMSMGI